jgi:hypothetical protein
MTQGLLKLVKTEWPGLTLRGHCVASAGLRSHESVTRKRRRVRRPDDRPVLDGVKWLFRPKTTRGNQLRTSIVLRS